VRNHLPHACPGSSCLFVELHIHLQTLPSTVATSKWHGSHSNAVGPRPRRSRCLLQFESGGELMAMRPTADESESRNQFELHGANKVVVRMKVLEVVESTGDGRGVEQPGIGERLARDEERLAERRSFFEERCLLALGDLRARREVSVPGREREVADALDRGEIEPRELPQCSEEGLARRERSARLQRVDPRSSGWGTWARRSTLSPAVRARRARFRFANVAHASKMASVLRHPSKSGRGIDRLRWAYGVRVLGMVVSTLAIVRPARADLRWVAPEGCSSSDELVGAVARALGRSAGEARAIDASAVVDAAPEGFAVRIEVAGGRRTVGAETCSEILEATALVIALAVDPSVRAVRPPSAAAPPPAAPAHTPPRVGATVMRSAGSAVRPEPPFYVGIAEIADVGTLPNVAIGATALFGARYRTLRIELGVGAFSGQYGAVGGDLGVDLRLVTGGAKVCYGRILGRIEAGVCGGVGIDSVAARGVGAGVRSVDGSSGWPTLGAEARLAVPLARWVALRLAFGAQVPLARPTFVVTGAGEVYRTGAVAGRQTFVVEVRFP
jgi:hypothetical protein